MKCDGAPGAARMTAVLLCMWGTAGWAATGPAPDSPWGTQRAATQAADRGDTVRVLFVGNSYTHYNNLPAILEAFAAAQAQGPVIRTGMVAPGGESLLDHSDSPRTLEAIRTDRWDVVVLQAQSTFGGVYLVDGAFRPAHPEGLWEGARQLRPEIESAGARTVLMEHWRRRDAPERDAAMIAFAFDRAARELNAPVAPVGRAWENAGAWGFSWDALFVEDGSHPSPAGSWLAAAVLYDVLTGRPAAQLPAEVRGPAVNLETERAVPDSVVPLARLEPVEAGRLGAAAREAVRAARLTAGGPALVDPGLPQGPSVPEPLRPVDLDALEGRWTGPLTVYPYPGTLALDLSRSGGRWTADVTVSFGGRPDDIHVDVRDLTVSGGEIRFSDPNGPNGGEVRYRGAWTGTGLVGIAEIVVPGAPIYGIGRWSLRAGNPDM